MNENNTGWNGWESQLNHKTERRRRADVRRMRQFRRIALALLGIAAIPGFLAITLCAFGVMSAVWTAVLTAASIALMSFVTGYSCAVVIRYK